MKNLLLTLGAVLAVCAVSFGVFYAVNCDPAVHRAARDRDAMAWLRVEFHPNDAQFAAIKKLHDEFGAQCAGHCAAILAARERHASPAELTALENTCVNAMLDHFRRVAALMPPGQGDRYLAIVLPRVRSYGHSGAPNLQVKP